MDIDTSSSLHPFVDESPQVQMMTENVLSTSGPYMRQNAISEDKEEESSDEGEGLLPRRASCPELVTAYKNPLMKKVNSSDTDDDFDSPSSAYCPFPSPLHVPKSMHNAFEYVDQHAKEIKLQAKESLHNAIDKVDQFAHRVWDGRWRVVSFFQLQEWQKDNEFLHHWHRPPMPCFKACLGSIFRLHTETGNIWTHLIGFVLFIGICTYFLCLPATYFISELQEKVVFFLFFLGAVLCLCFSTLFHTMGCHSERVFKIFGKLDYSGIALMIMGSFVPWIYYSFYCEIEPKVVYMSSVSILGVACISISQWDKFSTAKFRGIRAMLFAALGLSGVVPAVHYMVKHGFIISVTVGQLGWLALMALLYLTGAFVYAKRIPERYFPGKCDLWFQSHQIFHILVVVAAVVHFHGISNLQQSRYNQGAQCMN